MTKCLKLFLGIIVMGFCLSVGFAAQSQPVFAGAIIDTGDVSGGGGSGGGGSSSNNCSDPKKSKYLVECTGVSWIFYKSTVSAANAKELTFTPGADVTIAKSCAEHTDQNGGFWHFGRNAMGFSYNGYGSHNYVLNDASDTTGSSSRYLATSGTWGHMTTYNLAWYNSKSSWVTYQQKTSLGQSLYKDGVKIYEASKSNASATGGDVLADWKNACNYSNSENGTNYNCSSIPTNVRYFCYWDDMASRDVTLTLKAIDSSGNSLSSLVSDKTKTGTIKSGSSSVKISITAGTAPAGYTFMGFKSSTTGSYISTGSTTLTQTISDDTTRYAVYEKNTFQGKTSVSGATSGTTTTDWQSGSKTVTAYISNCSATSGCAVTFKHEMRRTGGSGGSSWSVSRTSNLTSKVSTTLSNNSGTFNPTSNNVAGTVMENTNLTLYPGMVVCETLTFQPDNFGSTSGETVCVHALGNAQPDDPDDPPSTTDTDPNSSDDSAFLRMKVKNSSVTNYSFYQSAVYAKPGDTLSFRATYNPTLQYTYYLKPQRLRINGGTIYPSSGTNSSLTVGTIFNTYLRSSAGVSYWSNAFSVQRSKDSFSNNTLIGDYTFTAGDTSRQVKSNTYSPVATSDVGKAISERAITNLNSSTKTTPSQVTFSESSGNLGNVKTTQISSSAVAYVPYNFVNTTEITLEDSTVLYAGENQSVTFNITTGTRWNSTTSGTYATRVDNAKWKIYACITGGTFPDGSTCKETSEYTGNLNTGTNNTGGSTAEETLGIIVPDVAAGTEICLTSMVYPANSGAETNWNDAEGSHTWASSAEKCFTVAKRPSLQVLGGNLYSGGAIKTSAAIKKHVSGVNDSEYRLDANSYSGNSYVFGSWGELGVIASGKVTKFASGAATGYSLGSIEKSTSFCKRVPLTFANAYTGSGTCDSSLIGSLGSTSTSDNTTSSISELFSKFISSETPTVTEVGETVVPKNTTAVYYSTGDLVITGNVTYEDVTYTSINEIPKTLIYATGEVKINCSVSRIDAVIVAEKVTTCANGSGDINDEEYSNQLVVNGAIITSSLVANRTYGAASGADTAYGSVTAAEIINFDVSLYRWEVESGSSESGSSESSTSGDSADSTNLTTTYLKELAPRY